MTIAQLRSYLNGLPPKEDNVKIILQKNPDMLSFPWVKFDEAFIGINGCITFEETCPVCGGTLLLEKNIKEKVLVFY